MFRKFLISTALTSFALRAFDPGKWKTDDAGNVVMKDGNPVFIDANGGEMTLGIDTINRLNGEARTLRQRAETAETAAKAFEGLDAKKAREALETVAKIDQKKLIDAGEVDRVKSEIGQQYMAQIDELKKNNEALQGTNHQMIRRNAFNSSEFIKNRIAVPPEMFEATFGSHFRVENNQLVPYGADGHKLASKKRIGETADFEEAVEILATNYQHKDKILLAPDATGSGGGGGGTGSGRVIRRADFNKMSPGEQADTAAKARKGEVSIVD